MKEFTAARKYAESLFLNLQDKTLDLEKFGEELFRLRSFLSAELSNLLVHPVIPLSEKMKALEGVMGGEILSQLREFIALLIEKKRVGLLSHIPDIFDDLLCRQKSVRKVRVESAFELTPAQKENMSRALQKKLGSLVRVDWRVIPSLIGGVVVRAEDFVMDNSLSARLRQLKQQYSER